MQLSRYVLANVLRNKRRTALTVLSIGFSLFLLIALWTFMHMLSNPPESDLSIRRLAVSSAISLGQALPVSYAQKIKTVKHVERVMLMQWCGGWYQDKKNMIGALASDPAEFFEVEKDYKTTPEVQKAYLADRRSALAGQKLMDRFGWKVGQTITLHGMIFPIDLELNIVGTYDHPDEENILFLRWDYLNEKMDDPGTIASFWVLADSPDNVPKVADDIDAMFRNSPAQTKTESEKAFRLGFVSMLGNIQLIISLIAGVVVFTMLLVTASTMSMTIRERTREVAILKSIGYPRRLLMTLIVGEGVTIAALGWLVALGFCVFLGTQDTDGMTMGFIPQFYPPLGIYARSLGIGLAIGLVAGLLPGWQAARMTIANAMRKLE